MTLPRLTVAAYRPGSDGDQLLFTCPGLRSPRRARRRDRGVQRAAVALALALAVNVATFAARGFGVVYGIEAWVVILSIVVGLTAAVRLALQPIAIVTGYARGAGWTIREVIRHHAADVFTIGTFDASLARDHGHLDRLNTELDEIERDAFGDPAAFDSRAHRQWLRTTRDSEALDAQRRIFEAIDRHDYADDDADRLRYLAAMTAHMIRLTTMFVAVVRRVRERLATLARRLAWPPVLTLAAPTGPDASPIVPRTLAPPGRSIDATPMVPTGPPTRSRAWPVLAVPGLGWLTPERSEAVATT